MLLVKKQTLHLGGQNNILLSNNSLALGGTGARSNLFGSTNYGITSASGKVANSTAEPVDKTPSPTIQGLAS